MHRNYRRKDRHRCERRRKPWTTPGEVRRRLNRSARLAERHLVRTGQYDALGGRRKRANFFEIVDYWDPYF